ncbi:hypothetical protein K493DRAFT_312897 [Basidiobolus meristosporus CBS 931.73]|uniref:Fumarylacetoacetase-like C-terminal domain-containing protein n=1 Tax=Basidiobolus meristosporus CBS 931.73 TaxID=1314790 RepID=A0A1Y1YQH1_9FUNG|nr:hypothetical protein K493DRAFT_312897 [Basidiobolus meristosporus CBS 931.73]|eukprot:ORY00282.1 hypothetical protein K493DRAFT_312897 [Basidiobolus meristosporus CBS 931.73]
MRQFASIGKKIIAIGRNYSEHAKELGNQVPSHPFFFLKPTSSYLVQPGSIEIPKGCVVHHEVELAVVIGKEGRDIDAHHADHYIAGYALGIDLTARNLQEHAKKKGLPWSTAKGFDTFTPISDFIAKNKIPDAGNVNLWLKVNNEERQNGNTKDMIFSIPKLIEHVSTIMKLEPGDIILTGTPSGVGPIKAGEIVTAGMGVKSGEDLVKVSFPVIDRHGKFHLVEH